MRDITLVVGVLAAMMLAAAIVALVIGRPIARRSRAAAILVSGLLPPVGLVLVEYGMFVRDADGHGDGPAMALVGSLIYALLALPFTLVVAAVVIRRFRPA
jgi:uncharacterized membrane protein YhaH (DUF805 family)